MFAITKFTPTDYPEFLKDEFPLEKCQPIIVTSSSSA